ncbi:right-handed parallel beta-helix repeat-containing protein [Leifsonia sp. NPDC056665]|uniref:right-handed parallel beta-helix repeat-containing protein n=1 Tax=Leifsonia sp. NPDC056665 TaxID=3345901 RepID=UPI0036BC9745
MHTPAPRKNRNILIAGVAGAAATALAVVGLPALTATAAPTSYATGAQIVSDDFSRTSAAGWGSAPVGGAYKVNSASSFSAKNGIGTMALPKPGASLTAGLPSVSAGDVTASATIDVPKIPTSGNGVFAGVQLRSAGGSYYQANIRVGKGGVLNLTIVRVNGSTAKQTVVSPEKRIASGLKAGSAVQLQFQATGTNPVHLQARAWLAGASQPGWQLSADDTSSARLGAAGSVAAWSYLSAASAATPVAFDTLTASKLVPVGSNPSTTPTQTPTPTPTQTPTSTPTPSSTPTSTPTTPPTSTPAPGPSGDPAIDTSGTRFATGAAAIGSTSYAVPAGAIVVSPGGSVQNAINAAPNGGTVVLRAGSYHESLTIPGGKKLTIQSYPKEAVYLDGSSVVSNWAQSGSTWRATGWNHVFDASPTFTRGAKDGTSAGWQWINPAYPMASHPDQLWVGGTAMKQVASASQVTAGTFSYDTAAKTLVLGTNPAGKEVRASDLQKAITVGAPGFTLKGIGVRRYAPSVPDMGAVTSYQGGATFENDSFSDMATTGVALGGSGNTLRNVTVARDGLLGVQANNADNLTLDGVLAADDNAEHFNTSPVSGGVKITRSRNITVVNSAFLHNQSHGLWFDESTYNMNVAHNDSLGNQGNGIVVEISATAKIADNVVSGNASDGLKLNNISNAQVWNNTLTNNTGRNLDITQDARRGNRASDAGHDPRQAFPDPTMTWITGPDTIRNNIISGGSGNCLLCVEDYAHILSGSQMGIDADYNLYSRPSASAPSWFAIWSTGAGNPGVYTSLSAFTSATGKGAHNTLVQSAPTGAAQPNVSTGGTATGLSSAIASLVGRPAGTAHMGAW